MSKRSKWALAYLYILICAFAFGIGYGTAYEEAWAAPCPCLVYTCPTGEKCWGKIYPTGCYPYIQECECQACP